MLDEAQLARIRAEARAAVAAIAPLDPAVALSIARSVARARVNAARRRDPAPNEHREAS